MSRYSPSNQPPASKTLMRGSTALILSRSAERSRWIGERPSLPDFRPAIGRAPRLANVYCAYGHQHVGLTLATATARLIARQIEGEEMPTALTPCDPGRFG